jgi:hypothetical protein
VTDEIQNNDSDREHLLNSVREAMSQHADDAPVEQEQAEAVDMGEQIAAQINQDEVRRDEPAGPVRDNRGRFARATSDASNDTFGPPTSWSADAKAAWQNLAPEVQAAISKREGEVERGFNEYRNRSQSNDELEQVLAPHRQTYAQLGFHSDSQAIRHLFEINQAFQTAPAATAFRIIQAMPADQQQQLRQALNGGQPNYSPAQFQQAVQQKAQELAQAWLAQHQLREFESRAPAEYDQVKPLMFALLQNGLATDLKSAYDLAMKPARTATEQAAKLDRKTKAANASLNGAPHGMAASQPPRSSGKGTFGDVAADVRAAINSLG